MPRLGSNIIFADSGLMLWKELQPNRPRHFVSQQRPLANAKRYRQRFLCANWRTIDLCANWRKKRKQPALLVCMCLNDALQREGKPFKFCAISNV